MTDIDELLELIGSILLRCVAQITLVLFLWWGVLTWFGDLAYRAQSRVVPVSRVHFGAIHYAGILATRLTLGIFFLAPCIAVRLEQKRRKK